MNLPRTWFPPVLALALAACSAEPASGPVDLIMSRDGCEHCRMLISDPAFVAEVRGGPRRALHKFDELGCALAWLAEQPWKSEPGVEIWVAASDRQGLWLRADQAGYRPVPISPMGYGWQAVSSAAGGVSFEELRRRLALAPGTASRPGGAS